MKRRIIWVNLVLAVLVMAAVVKVRHEWLVERQQEHVVKYAHVKPAAVPKAPIPAPPAPVAASTYSDIANKMLFSRDRNPNVVIEAPPPPVKKMPPLPLLHGVMGLPSGTLALLSLDAKSSGKAVKVGDKIGEFELAALSQDEISFHWEDQTVTKSVSEMIYRGSEATAAAGGNERGAAPAAAPAANTPSSSALAKPNTEAPATLEGTKLCTPGDSSPAGTVTDGFRKVLAPNPFGTTCYWEPVK
jgi:hypothetical protein